jgi:Mobilization protein NikA
MSARSSPRRRVAGNRFPTGPELRRVLTPTTPWAERDRAQKTDRVNVRISPSEKAEMAQTAERFGLGVSEYLLRLHRLTVAIQERRGNRRKSSPYRTDIR